MFGKYRKNKVKSLKDPLNNSLCTQRGLKRVSVVSCLEGQSGPFHVVILGFLSVLMVSMRN